MVPKSQDEADDDPPRLRERPPLGLPPRSRDLPDAPMQRCTICGKSFRTEAALEAHEAKGHPVEA